MRTDASVARGPDVTFRVRPSSPPPPREVFLPGGGPDITVPVFSCDNGPYFALLTQVHAPPPAEGRGG